ncbi:PREDICTED: mannan endo-1,4-beta-mannosidase 4-like [Nelumbo nucifera]|uniref:mannan endo-1,4-beta-mannosidase n=1 Tax=Nelumbo nucifera TaxID=4432 RepID=A0A1U7Z7B4_NELNU|nr:PREDICTED: mannan endo-1,4-beta-mannosidase 4-like [Nelumbo nucifera]
MLIVVLGSRMLGRRLFHTILVLVLFFFQDHQQGNRVRADDAAGVFVRRSGVHFTKNGNPFYFNGFNAYWLMLMASDPLERGNVTSVFQEATNYGMTVARTWAFSDGGSSPLQSSPGTYNEEMFKGLDLVISEAGKYGISLILSLVNNYPDFGGRKQYVQWAMDRGEDLSSEDDFYTNALVKGYYKNHVKTVLTRRNSISGVAYKDDPTIFAWELINEPHCEADVSGATLQEWIEEMATHVKSIDDNHLLEVGLEGFYGESKKQLNPHGYSFGTDFISNNQIAQIDFATIHAYPDIWFSDSDYGAQLNFLQTWLQVHIQDSNSSLGKPLIVAEFGKSSRTSGYNSSQRDTYFDTLYSNIYDSAQSGGPCTGGLFWQVLYLGMDKFRDGYEVILAESPSTASIIAQQSRRLSKLCNTEMPSRHHT